MIQIVNRTGKFMSQLTENQRIALEAVGAFCKSKMDEYVAVDTGQLRSRNTYVIARNELFLQNDCSYAIYQEYGTYKMAAHPFIKPAALNHTGEIKRIFADHLSKGMK
jgi:HK97 gp10 family phage protein